MNLHLVDYNGHLVTAWIEAFKQFAEVSIEQGDLLTVARHCVVSPANSYGFMDGGIDAAYRAFFGAQLERRVREAVTQRPEGHLPVGASLVVRTGHQRVPFMIVAPTMTVPEQVESRNCYRAMRAILRIACADTEVGRDVFCPGLATGVGMVPPRNAAAMMAEAYRDWKRSVEPDAVPDSRQPSQFPPSLEVQPSDSQQTPSSGACG
jgi:O-acetyl-ADP-ribose deacetylase (regulator of RNase III)